MSESSEKRDVLQQGEILLVQKNVQKLGTPQLGNFGQLGVKYLAGQI